MKIARCNCLTSNASKGIFGPLVPVEEKDGYCVYCDHAVVYTSSYDRFPRATKQSIRSGYRPHSQTKSVWGKYGLTEIYRTLHEDAFPEAPCDGTPLSEDLYVVAWGERRKEC